MVKHNVGSNVTSCGLSLAVLKCSVVYCCGTFLVMVVPATVAKKSKSLLAPVSTAGKKGEWVDDHTVLLLCS